MWSEMAIQRGRYFRIDGNPDTVFSTNLYQTYCVSLDSHMLGNDGVTCREYLETLSDRHWPALMRRGRVDS